MSKEEKQLVLDVLIKMNYMIDDICLGNRIRDHEIIARDNDMEKLTRLFNQEN